VSLLILLWYYQFDSLVQAATGFNRAEGDAWAKHEGKEENLPENIKTLPLQCLDHGAGQLLAFGIMAALSRSITVSGIRLHLLDFRVYYNLV
jgi:hypothetical protein